MKFGNEEHNTRISNESNSENLTISSQIMICIHISKTKTIPKLNFEEMKKK